jgi:plasmid stability protein
MGKRQLVVRDLSDDLVRRLRARAVEHGRSAEAEHREILRAALAPRRTFKEALLAMPDVAPDGAFARPRRMARRVRLG